MLVFRWNIMWDFFHMNLYFVVAASWHLQLCLGTHDFFTPFFFLWIIGKSTVCDKSQRVGLSEENGHSQCLNSTLNCWTLPRIRAAELGCGTRKTIPCWVVLVRNRENSLIENRSLLQNSFSSRRPLSCGCRWGARANKTEYIPVLVSEQISTCSTRCVITKSHDRP